jgi:hypothetical protein
LDIISHTLSGLAVGSVFASFCLEKKSQVKVILFGGIGGALPDIDAISLWSQFDHTIGSWLNLQHSGEEIYTGKFWYSHHAFLHSFMCSIICSTIIFFFNFIKQNHKNDYKYIALLSMAFLLGFNIHLWEDMPTPIGAWGGVNYFFPSQEYIGGYSKIWWWNNYDLFLIILGVLCINVVCLMVPKLKKTTIMVFLIGVFLFINQINQRKINYTTNSQKNGYMDSEIKSLEFQKSILGAKVYNLMVRFDKMVKINF